MMTRYSQDIERQADDYAAALLLQNGMSPRLLARALEKLAASERAFSKGGYLSTHPSTDQRTRRFRSLATSATAQ